jgi:DNA-binding GntR family transcriptional regulator
MQAVSRKQAVALKAGDDAGRRLSDIAYSRILEGLFTRRLPAGAFVSQNELASLLGVPVAPLRDALRVLETEGVLTIQPRSGIQFVKPGMELTRSTYQFRNVIERAAVRVFAETADVEDIRRLLKRHEEVVEHMGALELTPAIAEEIEKLENDLHGQIVRTLANPLIETTYRRLHNYLRLIRLDRRITAPLALRTLREHIEILKACEARDANRAEAALAAHFAAALQRMLGMF